MQKIGYYNISETKKRIARPSGPIRESRSLSADPDCWLSSMQVARRRIDEQRQRHDARIGVPTALEGAYNLTHLPVSLNQMTATKSSLKRSHGFRFSQ